MEGGDVSEEEEEDISNVAASIMAENGGTSNLAYDSNAPKNNGVANHEAKFRRSLSEDQVWLYKNVTIFKITCVYLKCKRSLVRHHITK